MNYHYKVLGVKRLDFVAPDTGERIDGCNLWVAAPTADAGWIGGIEVFKVWAANGTPLFTQYMNLRSGDEITGDCDRKGRPISVNKK